MKRKNRLGSRPYWDPFWPGAVAEAAGTLGQESVNVNGGVFFRELVQAKAVEALAELTWTKRRDGYGVRLAGR